MNNREILAKNISEKFISAISGNDKKQILEHNPEDRIYVYLGFPIFLEDEFSKKNYIVGNIYCVTHWRTISIKWNIRYRNCNSTFINVCL